MKFTVSSVSEKVTIDEIEFNTLEEFMAWATEIRNKHHCDIILNVDGRYKSELPDLCLYDDYME